MEKTSQKIFVSLFSSYVSQFSVMFVSFLARLILARIIAPESWGVYAEAFLIIMFLGAVRDLGINFQLIRDEDRHYGNALLMQLFMAVLLILVLQIVAPLFTLLNPDLPNVLRVYSFLILVEGVAVVPKAFIDRELIIKKAVIPEILRTLIFAVVSFLLALGGYEIWSLIYGQIVSAGAFAVMIWWKVRHLIPLEWTLKHSGMLIKRSYLLFSIWVLGVLWNYIDNGILGTLVTEDQVGYYFWAYSIAFLLSARILYPSVARVIYPALARYKTEDKGKYIKTYHYGTVTLMVLEVPLSFLFFFNTDFIVMFLLGEKWIEAIPLLHILSLIPILEPVNKLGVELLKVENKDKLILVSYVISLVTLVLTGWFLVGKYGVIGMAYANFIYLGAIPILIGVKMVIKDDFFRLYKRLMFIYGFTFVTLGAVYLLINSNTIARMIVSILALPLIWIVFYKAFGDFLEGFLRSSIKELKSWKGVAEEVA